MTEQDPEIVAAADLSPLAPSPVHTSPALVPSLQEHADALDVAFLAPVVSPPVVNMSEAPGPSTAGDTTAVGGDYSDDDVQNESIAEEDSFDAYGTNEDGRGQEAVEADGATDDYAKTFDSPAAQQLDAILPETGAEVPQPAPGISTASGTVQLASGSPASAALAILPPANLGLDHSGGVASNADAAAAAAAAAESTEATNVSLDAIEAAVAQQIAPAGLLAEQSAGAQSNGVPVDIQKLVDDITARAAVMPDDLSSTAAPPLPQSAASVQPSPISLSVSQPASLPPKPQSQSPMADQAPGRVEPPSPRQIIPAQANAPSTATPVPMPLPGTGPAHPSQAPYIASGAPGTTSFDAIPSMPPPPASTAFNGGSAFPSMPDTQHPINAAALPASNLRAFQAHQTWEQFQADEKRYMTEAKWERFPEGSRIFVGNLSSERISKREVFDVFSRFGRLAQISLKSAYGFVQYHTKEDADVAMQNAQGAELGGRKVHLEPTRNQKSSSKKEERERSPERKGRGGNRGGDRGGDRADRYDGREQGRRQRDDYRPGRSPSPRRDSYRGRDDQHARGGGHGHTDSFGRTQRRSRSPQRFGAFNNDQYRVRSPSPRRSAHGSESDRLDIPRRYGDSVPDVQFLLLEDVSRDFVNWVQRAFYDRGLKYEVMSLNPRFDRNAVIQRQVVEGVHGVIELTFQAHQTGKIPLQVFDRSAGINNVRFDQYKDLDPPIAAELVARTKAQSAAVAGMPAYPPPNSYAQPYPQQGPPAGYPYQPQPYAMPPVSAPAPAPAAADLSQLDNATLQKILASLQGGQGGHPGGMAHMAAPNQQQIDINALLGNIQGPAGPGNGMQAMQGYGSAPSAYAPGPGNMMSPTVPGGPTAPPPSNGGVDTAQQVQNILAQLARHR